jgi:hypothetical protein
MSETIAKFFEREEPVPPCRLESNEDRSERESLTDLGGWAGGNVCPKSLAKEFLAIGSEAASLGPPCRCTKGREPQETTKLAFSFLIRSSASSGNSISKTTRELLKLGLVENSTRTNIGIWQGC